MVDYTCSVHFMEECTHERCIIRKGTWTESDFQAEIEDQRLDEDCDRVSFVCTFMQRETTIIKGEATNYESIW